MFKKLKDKLTEEMKQSPARLQASMQQLAQAVPGISNTSTSELSASNDNFSLTDGDDETPTKNISDKHKLQAVDLTSYSSNPMELSRTLSVSSVASTETSGFFGIYEGSTYHLQSDMDQSASEVDEHINTKFDQVSKEQIYTAYRKVQTKYEKYRGRYTDLANHYREMERAKCKLESLLVETQDHALRRIADLKEQCQLEQQAKAHLEEALRNDIEEKDHIIDTLNTKVKLLQTNGSSTILKLGNHENLIDIIDNNDDDDDDKSEKDCSILPNSISTSEPLHISQSMNSSVPSYLIDENQQLKIKLDKLENINMKYEESLKHSEDKIFEITQDKLIVERELESMKNSNYKQQEIMTERLNEAKAEIIVLNDKINAMKRVEEESAISLAENKLSIHRELEIKEEQIKQLTLELKNALQVKESVEMVADDNSEINDAVKNDSEAVIEDEVVGSQTKSLAHNTEFHRHSQQDETIKSLNEMIEAYTIDINEAKGQIQAHNTEIIQLTKESKENYEKLRIKFENKCSDALRLDNELLHCRSTINQLDGELKNNANTNAHLIEQNNNLIKHIVVSMTTIRALKYKFDDLKAALKESELNKNQELVKISKLIQETLGNYESRSNETYRSCERELREKNTEIIYINEKLSNSEAKNCKLIAELEDVNKVIEEKNLLDRKLQEIETKYVNQLDMIQTMQKEIDTMRITIMEQEQKINHYNDEKQNLITGTERAMILEEECKRLSHEIAEITTNYCNKISLIECENDIYKNNIAENAIQLKNSVEKQREITVQYENLEYELNRNTILLQEELEKSQNLTAENFKHSNEKSALNIQIQNLTDMVRAKNEYIEKLKLINVKSRKIIQDKDLEINNMLAVKETLENFQKSMNNERLQLNESYSTRIKQLTDEKTELINSNVELNFKINEYKDLEQRLANLLTKNNVLQSELNGQREIDGNLECQIQGSSNFMTIIEDLQNYKEKSDIEKKELKNVVNELSKANEELQDGKNSLEERVQELEALTQLHLKDIAHLKNEIEDKTVEFDKSRQEVNHNLQIEENSLRRVIEELQSRLQEKESMFTQCQATQSKIESINDELRNEAEILRQHLSTIEAEQTVRMQQLVKEFQARINDKDLELQSALDQKFDWQKNYESELVQQYREQLKDFQLELTAKSEEIEDLKVGKNAGSNEEIKKLVEIIATMKMEHANELKEADMMWRATLKQKCDQLETQHNVIINELTNEWKKNKFTDENNTQHPEELGNMSAMAIAAVQSNTGSFQALQQTVVNQRRELIELRKLLKIRHETLDDSTEIEYLRNILYEYMMGKETLVLARVIAAVVKFDHDQTNKILKKEEDKLTLLGSLGLS